MKNFVKIALIGALAFVLSTPCEAATLKPDVMEITFTPTADFELITLTEAKAHLRLDAAFDYEDNLILAYRDAAISACETYMNRDIVSGAFEVSGKTYADISIRDWRKVGIAETKILVSGIEDYDVLSPDLYTIVNHGRCYTIKVNSDVPALQDVSEAVKITGTFTVPMVVKQACLITLTEFYEVRENRPDPGNDVARKLLFGHRNHA